MTNGYSIVALADDGIHSENKCKIGRGSCCFIVVVVCVVIIEDEGALHASYFSHGI